MKTDQNFAAARRKRTQSGFSLFGLAGSATVLLVMVGLSVGPSVDLGRMFIVKNQLQAFVYGGELQHVADCSHRSSPEPGRHQLNKL